MLAAEIFYLFTFALTSTLVGIGLLELHYRWSGVVGRWFVTAGYIGLFVDLNLCFWSIASNKGLV